MNDEIPLPDELKKIMLSLVVEEQKRILPKVFFVNFFIGGLWFTSPFYLAVLASPFHLYFLYFVLDLVRNLRILKKHQYHLVKDDALTAMYDTCLGIRYRRERG